MLLRKVLSQISHSGVSLNLFLQKSCHTQNDIMLIDNGKVIVEKNDLVEKFNDHYINIVEKSSGRKPCNFASVTNSLEDDVVINEIVQHYSNYPNILKIKKNFDNSQTVE